MMQGSARSAGLPGEAGREGSGIHQEDHFITQVTTSPFHASGLMAESCSLHACNTFLAVHFHPCRTSVCTVWRLFEPKCRRKGMAVAAILLPTAGHLHMTRRCLKQQSCSARDAPCPVVQQGTGLLALPSDASNHTMVAGAVAYYSSSHVHVGRHGSPQDQLCSLCLGICQTYCQQCLQRYDSNLCDLLLMAQWRTGSLAY